jgi:hypothetical protein
MRTLNRITGSLVLTALLGACGQPMAMDQDIASTGTSADVISGVLEIAVVDMEDSAYHLVTLRTADGETIRLRLRDEQFENFRSGDAVSVLGVRSGDEIDLTSGGSLLAAQSELASSRSALVQNGPRPTAVVLFNFRNDTTQPLSKAQVQGALFTAPDSLNSYYKEISNNAISLTGIADKVNGDAFGYYTISADNTNCSNPFAWTDQVDMMAKAQGVDLSTYANVIYISPDAASCGWAGIAHMPGRKAIIKASMVGQYPKVIAHEFGHNLGFAHANVFKCSEAGKAVPLSATCSSQEYGDLLDPMGIGVPRPPTHTNIRNKSDASWMASRITDVRASGEYTFSAANVPSAGPLGLRIPRPDGTFMWLETRAMAGFDGMSINNATHALFKGVTIRVAKESGTIQTQLVDANPGTDSVDDAPFLPGSSLVDSASRITVTVLSVASGIAKVKVDMTGAPPPPPPPSAPPSSVPAPTSNDPVVRVTSVYSGMPISVVGSSPLVGAQVEQAANAGLTSQQMRFQYVPGGFLFRPMHSELCLEVAGSSTAPGAPLLQAGCTASAGQRFLLEPTSTGYRFRNANSNLCLDIAGFSRLAGARIVQQACSTAASQSWRLYLAN